LGTHKEEVTEDLINMQDQPEEDKTDEKKQVGKKHLLNAQQTAANNLFEFLKQLQMNDEKVASKTILYNDNLLGYL